MACRIRNIVFRAMAQDEADPLGLRKLGFDDGAPRDTFDLAEVVGEVAILNKKAIQSLVDEPEQARPIVRNLLRWAKEHGAK